MKVYSYRILRSAFIPAFIFITLFYFYPLTKIFFISFFGSRLYGSFKFISFISSSYYLKIIWFTLWQAAVSTILTLIVSMPGAYIFGRYSFLGKKAIIAFATISFMLPTVVVAAAFDSLLGDKIGGGIWLISIAHVFFNYSVFLRIVGGFWARIDPDIENASLTLGNSNLKTFFKITLPLLKPAVIAASMLVFIFSFSSFGIVLILGGSKFSTIEVEIYKQAAYLFNLPNASFLALIQMFFLFIFLFIYSKIQSGASISLNSKIISNSFKIPSNKEKFFIIIHNILMLIFLASPIISIFISSLKTENGWSLYYYKALFYNKTESLFFIPPLEAVKYSVLFALITILISLIIGLSASFALSEEKSGIKHILDPILMLPLTSSAVTLGLGFILALDKPPLNLRNSIMLTPIAHSLVAFPFVLRSMLPVIKSIPKNLKQAAAVLGASPFHVFKNIDLPVITKAVIIAAIFSFCISMGEFGASVFTARPSTMTMPIAIYRFLSMPGEINYGQAMAMSSILTIITGIGIFFLETKE